MADEKKMFSSRRSRFFKLGGLTAKVSSSYLAERVKGAFLSDEQKGDSLMQANIANAKRMVETFGQLKGAVMKLGQHMSIISDILPPEMTEILASLQNTAPPVPFSQLKEQFINELGKAPEEVFAWFDEKAYKSASIGQVHRAGTKDGVEVAVKIQFPEIDKMVESDLANLKMIANAKMMMVKADIEKLFDEIRERLTDELDYRIEKENLSYFRDLFADYEDIIIPGVLEEYSTRRVLTMEFVEGQGFDLLTSDTFTDDERNAFALKLYRFTLEQLFTHHVLHADPHPGNFAISEDGRLVVYDFGSMRRYSPEFIEKYKLALVYALRREYGRLIGALDEVGIKFLGKKKPGVTLYKDLTQAVLEPFFMKAPYPIHECLAHETLQKIAKENFMTLIQYDAPKEILMLDRVIVGMYGNFRKLKATVDWYHPLASYLGLNEP